MAVVAVVGEALAQECRSEVEIECGCSEISVAHVRNRPVNEPSTFDRHAVAERPRISTLS